MSEVEWLCFEAVQGAPSTSPFSCLLDVHNIHELSRAAPQSTDADQSPRLLHMSAYHTRHIPGPARVPSSCPFGRHDSAASTLTVAIP